MNEDSLNNKSSDNQLTFLLNIGEKLIESGAESFNVQTTIEEIGNLINFDVICELTATTLFITNKHNDTGFRKVKIGEYDLQNLQDILTLKKSLASKQISLEDFYTKMNQIHKGKKDIHFSKKHLYIASGLVTLNPTFVRSASFFDFLCSIVIGSFLYYVYLKLKVSNNYIKLLIIGTIASITALISSNILSTTHSTLITVLSVMPFIPGLSITSAIREILLGDILSGLVLITKSILIIVSILSGLYVGSELSTLILSYIT